MRYETFIPLLMALFLFACSVKDSQLRDEKLQSLYVLRIPNSSKVIYDYSYQGPMSFSSDITGLSLQDSILIFNSSNINKLPGNILTRVSSDTLMLSSSHSTEFGLIERQGLKILTRQASPLYGASSTGIHYFGNIEECGDDVIFSKIKHESGKGFDSMVFTKCLLRVEENDDKSINKIEITSDELFIRDSTLMIRYSYEFYPLDANRLMRISDWGVFKKIK